MFGFKTKNNVQARKIKIVTAPNEEMYTTFTLKWYDQKADVKFNSIHQGMLNNVLAASTIAYMLKVPFNAVIQGIKQYTPFENRFQPRKIKATRSTVISDCYNANPDSMKAAIQAFDAIQTNSKKIAIIGDMRELGTREVYWHRLIGRMLCNASSIEQVILVGDLVKFVASVMPENMIAAKVQTWQEAEVILKKYLADHEALVLVKASHSIALDKLVDSIC
jgi:UDP-N-acetylmuramoyl-tripeptide--D-alanyl-D-alanine ligase